MDYYDSEYRRQYCRERVARIRDEYRRVQAAPRDSRRRERVIAQARKVYERVRQAPRRVPAYRS